MVRVSRRGGLFAARVCDVAAQGIILQLLLVVTEDLVGVVNVLKFVLVHATRTVWVVLVAKLVVGVLYVFVRGTLRQTQNFVVVYFRVEVKRRWGRATTPERASVLDDYLLRTCDVKSFLGFRAEETE